MAKDSNDRKELVKEIREIIKTLADSDSFHKSTINHTDKAVSSSVSKFMEDHLENVQILLDKTQEQIIKEFKVILNNFGLHEGDEEKIRRALEYSHYQRRNKERIHMTITDQVIRWVIPISLMALAIGFMDTIKDYLNKD